MTSLRSYILLGGHDPEALGRAQGSGADLIIFDFEDMVPDADKPKARLRVRSWLETEDLPQTAVGVRVNAWKSGPDRIDRAALSGLDIAHVLLPKIESVADVDESRAALAASNLGSPALHVVVETADAVTAVRDIAGAGLISLFVGAFDLSKALGIEPDPNGKQIFHARQQIAEAAIRSGIAAFDMPFVDLADAAGFADHIQQAKHLGFTGCAAMNGDQAERINDVFGAVQ